MIPELSPCHNWEDFIKSTTLSSSGWRRIFNSIADPLSFGEKLDTQHEHFITIATEVIAGHFKKKKKVPMIALGRDSRPTGKNIADIVLGVLANNNIHAYNLGVTALPQCSATVKANSKLDGFIFITASHNPPGYNGIKIGGHGGEIISNATNQILINALKKKLLSSNESLIEPPINKSQIKTSDLKNSFTFDSQTDYRNSLLKNMGYHIKLIHYRIKSMISDLADKNYAIGCDFNGSARINAIDKSLISELSIHFLSCNDKLGEFVHDIVPEQESLNTLKQEMGSRNWKKYQVLFGYAVDCDGDRGNIVVNTQKKGKVSPLAPDAQTTFALTVLAELCYIETFFPNQIPRTVIVANDPTSLRIDALATKFGVKVARSEVGETNVVNLARQLRRRGHFTPVIGEGSNGGSIIHPNVVRDPLSMVTSLIKFLFLSNVNISLRDVAVNKLGLSANLKKVPPEFFLGELIPCINSFHSSSVFNSSSLIKTPYSTQKNFKRIYEHQWSQIWKNRRQDFKSWGIVSYLILNYEGVSTYIGAGNRHGKEDGGHKISFYDNKKVEIGFVWFRFSKTEPVLRLSSEHSNLSIQKKLFDLQHDLLLSTAKEDNYE